MEGGPPQPSRPPPASPPRIPPRRPAELSGWRIALAATIVVMVTVALVAPEVLRGESGPSGISPADFPIRHIVIVLMENHAYDNLFGTYCLVTGAQCPDSANGIPPGTCVPMNATLGPTPCVRPFAFTAANFTPHDMPHTYPSTIASIDGGRMDGFYEAERSGLNPFGYYNGATVPIYWDLAEQYGLGDNFFSSALSYSLPNHWYLLAGQAPPASINLTTLDTVGGRHTYLNESNTTETVEDLLNATPSVSWAYYDWALDTYQQAINFGIDSSFSAPGSAYAYWNPLAAKYESYTQWYVQHFQPRSNFFDAAQNGTLPDISWVIPALAFSDHPPQNLTYGQGFVASVVDAVEESRDWGSTAIFLAWDDYGGFYDGVAPPSIDPLGLSIRVPLVVISPYTPRGLVDSGLGYFESLLHFVEWRFGLGCITARDCNAPLPLGFFDLSQAPRPPMLFPTNFTNATYPLPAEGTGGWPYPVADGNESVFGIDPTAWDTGPPPANDSDTDLD